MAAASAAVVVLAAVGAEPAAALSEGVEFSAVSMPTWQTDGVAYAVTSSSGKVVVGGSFTGLRPPGASATTQEQAALAVLDADSGKPDACQFRVEMAGGTPVVRTLTTSPDGSVVYVGGNFTSISGVQATRVGALDLSACSVRPLKTVSSGFVNGLTATADTLYMAGEFTSVSGLPRRNFAAVDATTGDVRPWVADADRAGRALSVSPDGARVALGGDFTTLNGADSHSIAVVDAVTGAVVRSYPAGFIPALSVTKSIASDGESFYVGNEGTGTGEFDGRLAIDWNTLDERWRDTCLGATQAVLPYHGTLYSVSHAHDCGTMNLFPNGSRHFFMAQSTRDASIRGWFPQADNGIGEQIGGRGIALAQGTSGARYLYAVGEFTKINDVPQQGITRFGTEDTAPLAAPVLTASPLNRHLVQLRVGTVVDKDDDTLTYRIYRDDSTTPLWTGRSTSWWWSRPQITVTDRSAVPGRSHTYRVEATDGTNVSPRSNSVTVQPATAGADYATRVRDDGATIYWRFDERSGSTAWNQGKDSAEAPAGLLEWGVGLGAKGAFGSDPAATFDGSNDFAWTDQLRLAPNTYSLETWIRTTTTQGGKIIGFTDSRPRTDSHVPIKPTKYDRQVYMDDAGRLVFGADQVREAVVRSRAAYNDGRWHHVAATQGAGSGMRLYVDGVLVGKNAVDKAQAPYWGVWKVGGDRLKGWPHRPTSDYFAGNVDETAVYEGTVLPASTVATHVKLARGAVRFNNAPSSRYGALVYGAAPTLYWPLDGRSRTIPDKSREGQVPGKARTSVKTHVKGAVGHAASTRGRSSSTISSKSRLTSPDAASVELWFKTKSAKGNLLSFQDKSRDSSRRADTVLYFTRDGALAFGRAGQENASVVGGQGLDDNQWHHVVGVASPTSLTLYVDGASVGSVDATAGASFPGYWRLGGRLPSAWPEAGTSSFSGTLDEVAVYDRLLQADEVAAHTKGR